MIKEYISMLKECEQAIAHNTPVVALESTIITHGMSYPENMRTALALEEILREHEVCPATIAILNGTLHIGLTSDEIKTLAQKNRNEVIKASTKDIAYTVVTRNMGSTTVAATSYIADMVGIKVFATGGIGGVHRGGANTFDVSADIAQLAHTPVAVVCAGAKSILDLELTLEYLETQSIPVVGYQTDVFPAFYSRNSGHKLDMVLSSPSEIAEFLQLHWDVNSKKGVIIANPIPEEYSLGETYMDIIITQALQECASKHIKGKDVTPFVLSSITEKTNGRSVWANIELVKNNVRLAAQISKCLARVTV